MKKIFFIALTIFFALSTSLTLAVTLQPGPITFPTTALPSSNYFTLQIRSGPSQIDFANSTSGSIRTSALTWYAWQRGSNSVFTSIDLTNAYRCTRVAPTLTTGDSQDFSSWSGEVSASILSLKYQSINIPFRYNGERTYTFRLNCAPKLANYLTISSSVTVKVTKTGTVSSNNEPTVPTTPQPKITISLPPTIIRNGATVGDSFTVTWTLANIPATAQCWNNYSANGAGGGLSGWADNSVNGVRNLLKNRQSGTTILVVATSGSKRLRIVCGYNPDDWANTLTDVKIDFSAVNPTPPPAPQPQPNPSPTPATPIANLPTVSNVRIDGPNLPMADKNIWLAGAYKKITWDFYNFSPTSRAGVVASRPELVRWVSISINNPITGAFLPYKTALAFPVGYNSHGYNLSSSQMIGLQIPAKIDARDPAIIPYFNGYQSRIKICPVFADGVVAVPMTNCGLSPVFTVRDPNNGYSSTYGLPAGQGCVTGSCVCVNGVKKVCGNPMIPSDPNVNNSSCPYRSTNYSTGTCGSQAMSEQLLGSAQTAFVGVMDILFKIF